jgi:lysophospholipase L1-like esterase
MKKYKSKYDFYRGPSRRRNILYAVFVVVLFFGSLEGVLRVFEFGFYVNFSADLLGMPLLDMTRFRRITNRTVDFDPYLFWKFKPDQVLDAKGVYRKPVSINSKGFRGPEFSEPKPGGTFRIICIGDSSTFGWSVGEDETYAYYLERLLNQKYPWGWFDVLNLGVTGYSSRQGRELFSRQAVHLEPDLVIFAFGPNDRLPALKSDAAHLRESTWAVGRVQVFLNRIQVYKLIKSGVIYIENRVQGLSLDPATFISGLVRKVNQEEFAENSAEVKRLCDRIGAGLILVNVDYPSEPMDPATRLVKNEALKAGVPCPAEWRFWDSSALIQEIANELDVPALDLRRLFSDYLELLQDGDGDQDRAGAKRKQVGALVEKEPWRYLMVDNGHPDAWGHELIATALLEKVEADSGFAAYLDERSGE